MTNMEELKYSWFPDNASICEDIYNSQEEAIADAQKRFDNEDHPYEDGDMYTSPVISVGRVRTFNIKDAVTNFLESIEDHIGDQMCNFASGCDTEAECSIQEKDRKSFLEEASTALYPIAKKYLYVFPEWVCGVEIGKYDLSSKAWVEKVGNKETEVM